MFSINNLFLEFPGRVLFDHVTFVVNPRDRIGLSGKNGAGKSTLLKIINGDLAAQSGNIVIPKDKTVGYLVQERNFTSTKTVFEETLLAYSELNFLRNKIEEINKEIGERKDYESQEYMNLVSSMHHTNERIIFLEQSNNEGQIEKVLKGLGFTRSDFDRPMNEFSGGWQMRVELAKLLLRNPDLLLLDEPTNHLDIDSIQWLEQYLGNYIGAVMLVSHDRVLLDKITNRTIEIEHSNVYDYNVPYSKYLIQREERIEQLKAEQKNKQRIIDQNTDFIERFRYKATKAKQVQSRIKMIEKIDILDIDERDSSSIHFTFRPTVESGKIVIEATDVAKAYGEKQIISKTDFIIARNERIAFIGQNGQGKSTLVKMIMNEIDFEGNIKIGHNVKIGYFAQNQIEKLDKDKTVYETLEDIADSEMRPKLRGILGNFLFSGEDIDKKVAILSGGEKTRLALAKMLLLPVNFLILDEPTNHLDLAAKDVLKNALLNFTGTTIIVSHDRYFLSGLTTRIFEFRNRQIIQQHFSMDELMEMRQKEMKQNAEIKKTDRTETEKTTSSSKMQYEAKKELDRKKRKLEKDVKTLEDKISNLENKISEVENALSKPDDKSFDFNELSKKHNELNQELENCMNLWENSNSELEKFEQTQ